MEKNSTTGLPFSRIFPRTMPSTMENTLSPRIFILPGDDVVPAGTVSEPAYSSFLMVVTLTVPFEWTATISSSDSRRMNSVPVTL